MALPSSGSVLPAGQSWHEVLPDTFANRPGLHVWHEGAPTLALYVPLAQCLQRVAAVEEANVPSGQSLQRTLPIVVAFVYVPGEHAGQAVMFPFGLAKPGEHGRHDTLLL